ncbi:MAG: antibiotic biosynthesis monooxygenase [Syntrophaceae bacterium]|nr:antibiotic biosynthesis monooxygenase [Syntrophaceae bacterium]
MEIIIEFKAKRSGFQELYQTLQALIPTIRKKKGLQKVNFSRDSKDDENFILSFEWEDQKNLQHYLRSNDGQALLGAIEVLSEQIKVKLGNHELIDGIESLKKLRDEI